VLEAAGTSASNALLSAFHHPIGLLPALGPPTELA
jgi:hypothetical protein